MRSSGLLIAGPIVACLLSGAVSAQVTQRVSVSSGGVQGNSDSAIPVISADGRYVAFASWATNLAPGNFNGELEAFVRDRQLGMTELVSMSTGGIAANDQCFDQSISADGRYVAFSSYGSNLVPGDTGGHGDVFVRDRRSGTTERVSVDSGGVQGNQSSWSPSISADGRFVAFMSAASNFAAGDQWNGLPDAFVHDRQTGVTECVSVVSHGGQLRDDRWYLQASISADGRYVVFTTYQNNLVSGDTDGYRDLFPRHRHTGTPDCVSVGPNGAQFERTSWIPSISADGRYVAFASLAT